MNEASPTSRSRLAKDYEAGVMGYCPAGDTPAGPAVWTGADSL